MLKAESLSIKIKETPIVQGLSFDVNPGSCVGVIGPNGSGKTTLLRAISGILPYSGELLFKQKRLTEWSKRQLAARLAILKQNASVHFDFTVLDFVLLGRLPHKSWLSNTSAEDRAIVGKILERLQLDTFQERLITTLSGGERQRVLLAQALAQKPEMLLLDEPTANLDIFYQLDFLNHIKSLIAEGLAVVAVFHDISLAVQYADSILVLQKGKQIAFGPSDEVITPELLEAVFHVKSTIVRDQQNHLHIQYLNTL